MRRRGALSEADELFISSRYAKDQVIKNTIEHMREVEEKTRFKCPKCSRDFETEVGRLIHISRLHKRGEE